MQKQVLREDQIKFAVDKEFKHSFEFSNFQKIFEAAIDLSKTLYFERFSRAYDLSQKNDSITLSNTYHKIYDSVYHAIYDSTEKAFRARETLARKGVVIPVEADIVLSAATAQVKEAIPLFKASLTDPNPAYGRGAVELALAILGDTVYQKKYFDLHKQYISKPKWISMDVYADIRNLLLINTQKSIGLLNDWMDTTKKYSDYSEGFGDSPTPHYFAEIILPSLFKFVKDTLTQQAIMKLPEIGPTSPKFILEWNITIEQILFMKKWMLANKGKYELD